MDNLNDFADVLQIGVENLFSRPHKGHKRVPSSQLHRGGEDLFTQQRHYASYLAERLINFANLRGSDLTPLQASAASRHRRDPVFDISDHARGVRDTAVTNAYFSLLDSLFFFNTLGPRCKLIHSTRLPGDVGKLHHPQWARKEGIEVNGQCISHHHLKSNLTREIHSKLVLYDQSYIRKRSARLRKYIDILIHEMSHAFFQVWACGHRGCSKGPIDKLGITGHGFAWLDAAHAIEKAVSGGLVDLGYRVSLGRKEGAAVELKKRGWKVEDVGTEMWRKWGLDRREVECFMGDCDCFDDCRESEGSGHD